MTTKITEALCENCMWSKGDPEDPTWGVCHRYPPQVVVPRDGKNFAASFPRVKSDWACGEWKRAPEKEPEVLDV